MSAATASPPAFADAARRLRRRIWLRRWLAWLERTRLAAAGSLALAALAGLWLPPGVCLPLVAALLLLWLLPPLLWLRWRQPDAYAAFALWDRAAGRREAFASAWWFEQRAELTGAERHHLELQRPRLADALPALARDLPLPRPRQGWLPPLLAVLGCVLSTQRHSGPADPVVDAAMERAAQAAAEQLAREDWPGPTLDGLTPADQKQLEELRAKLNQTAQALRNSAGRPTREVLAGLEKQAHAAEQLAERLGAEADSWASPALTEALRRQTDTADLGDAVAAKNAAQTAAAAARLAGTLNRPALPAEVRDRLNTTLQEARRQAEAEDRQRTVGQHALGAGDRLEQGRAADAAREFDQLADKMRDLAKREQTRQELDRLAQQLREAGNRIAAATPGSQQGGPQPMQAVGQNQPEGAAGQGGSSPASAPLQAPGLGQAPPANVQPAPSGTEPTGQGGRVMNLATGGQPGQPPPPGTPMLVAPVPGQKPGSKPPEQLMLGGPPGEAAENAPSLTLAMPGGREPGAGKAELKAEASRPQASAGQATVNAQRGQEGAASVRAVEGGARQEQAATAPGARPSVEFLQAEEAALDEAALPPSRREQVRRYFNELRKRFESQP